MSNLSINQALSGLQNLLPIQQQVADADKSDSSGDPVTPEAANGQNVPDAAAETAPAAASEGSSAPVLSSDMNAVLLQLQESQEMTDARALLYGDGSSGDLTNLFGSGTSADTNDALQAFLGQQSGSSTTSATSTDPLQAFLSQMSATDSSLQTSNKTLLDYLNATDGKTDNSGLGLGTDALLA